MASDYKADEEILGKAYDAKLMRRLLAYVKPYKGYIIAAILLNIVVAALGPVRPFLTKIAIDDYIAKSNYHGVILITILLFAALLLQSVIQYFLTYYTQLLGQRTILDLRTQLFRHTQKLAVRFYDKTPIGRLVTRVTNDVESLNELFSSGIVMVFSDLFIIVWILIFMFSMDWELSLVSLSVLPLLIYGTFLFRKKVRESYRDVRLHLARLNSYMQEHITGMSIIQIFNKEKEDLSNFSSVNKDHKTANINSIFYYAVFFPGVEFMSSLAIALIIWYGGGEIVQGKMSLGVLFAFIQFTEMFFRPIRDLSEKYNILQTAMASSERIFKLLDDKTMIEEPAAPVSVSSLKGEIEFRNVCFAYNGDDHVLKNISFRIEPGQTCAIVGATGAGKTSIINILTRFYDINKGEILLDGVNIKNMRKEVINQNISIVLQDVFLFSGSIKENIGMNNENISADDIKMSAEAVGAADFITALPGGYDYAVKERGATLSVGQKQLISFARALAHDPRILILDEATSSVDTETEIIIQNAIRKLLAGRTSIVIAHRLSTVQNADNIIVLHKGEIREMGTHQELLAKKGIYFRLYQLQYKEQEIGN
ncbi:MAG: ABC transporter ATP-binding protein [Ignavibacteriaceae bacterium]|nr:ABC transporter ATP-binding protein [Ignavibacteriaceae bacterium]